jgi:hypothetical protein
MLFKNSKAASPAHDMLKIFREAYTYKTRKLFMEFRLQKGGEPPVEDFKSSGLPLSSWTDENIKKIALGNPRDRLRTNKYVLTLLLENAGGNNPKKYRAISTGLCIETRPARTAFYLQHFATESNLGVVLHTPP